MLTKMDLERRGISSAEEFDLSLAFCMQAKNACSLKNGFAPEMLVLGKQTKLPGSIASGEHVTSHLSALNETPAGIRFRERLALRERARRAFHAADNDESLRRSVHRRSCPIRVQYSPGEWVMHWKRGLNGRGEWIGPMRVIVQENQNTIWATMLSRMFRISPEQTRPVTSAESHQIPPLTQDPQLTPIESQLTGVRGQGVTRFEESIGSLRQQILQFPEHSTESPQRSSSNREPRLPSRQVTIEQPDDEPGSDNLPEVSSDGTSRTSNVPKNIPVPEESDSELLTTGFVCTDLDGPDPLLPDRERPLAWRQEFQVTEADVERWAKALTPLTCHSMLARARSKEQRFVSRS